MRNLIVAILAALAATHTGAAALEDAIKAYVLRETRGLAGRVSIAIKPIEAGSRIGDCANPEVFLPAGTRLWGAINIGVRCAEPSIWTVYIPVEIRVYGQYLVASSKIPAGRVLSGSDLDWRDGELTALPGAVLTDLASVIGKRTRIGIAANLPLRPEHLLQLPAIRQGQTVRLVARGPSFSISSEGKALANANDGESVRVKNPAGQTLVGVARANGVVEIAF